MFKYALAAALFSVVVFLAAASALVSMAKTLLVSVHVATQPVPSYLVPDRVLLLVLSARSWLLIIIEFAQAVSEHGLMNFRRQAQF